VGAHSSGTRFDYLFERIAAETTDEIPVIAPVRRARRWWPFPVVAAVVGVAGAVVVVQSWPGPVEVSPGSTGTETRLTATPIVSTAPVLEAPPVLATRPEAPPAVEPEPVVEAPPVVPIALAPEPAPPPPPPSSMPEPRQAATPVLRAPMSVSPEPRTAFPNQNVPDNDNNNRGRGGLLGRLGL
jgi:hypothetical protein